MLPEKQSEDQEAVTRRAGGRVVWPYEPGRGVWRVLHSGKKEKKEVAQLPESGDRKETVRPDKPKSRENPLVT